MLPLLAPLLVDKVPSVLASALSAWEQICPEQTGLLHHSYRQICRMLIEMDEWGQLVALRVLTIYVRRCFEEPIEKVEENSNPDQFYDENTSQTSTLDPDLELLYKCALQLIHSRSSAVPISSTGAYVGHHRFGAVFPPCSPCIILEPHNPQPHSSSQEPLRVNIIPRLILPCCHRISASCISVENPTNNRTSLLPSSRYSMSSQQILHI